MSTLGALLEHETYSVYYASSKSNKVARLMDMLHSVLHYRRSADIVLIDTYSTQNFYYSLFVSQLCRLLNLPYISILHGGDLPLRLSKNPKLCHLIFNHSKFNVAPSWYLKKSFEDFGYKNIIYIPNSIAIINYSFLNRNHENPRLLWVRSFSKIYNPKMAIEVLQFLKNVGMDASLCMVGPDSDGSLKNVMELANDLNLKVEFTGKLTKQQWTRLSEDYNVFINTSNIDNTPISVIEAMALGIPIVSTNVGGIPYLIEHETHGLLVEKNNTAEMAEAILTLFNHPVRRDRMVVNARKLSETFDWNRIKTQWNEILNN